MKYSNEVYLGAIASLAEREQLALGRRVLPMGDCDNFDYQTGCRGHIVEDDEGIGNDGTDR